MDLEADGCGDREFDRLACCVETEIPTPFEVDVMVEVSGMGMAAVSAARMGDLTLDLLFDFFFFFGTLLSLVDVARATAASGEPIATLLPASGMPKGTGTGMPKEDTVPFVPLGIIAGVRPPAIICTCIASTSPFTNTPSNHR